jgi:hypothetical protein
MKEYE